MTYDDIMLILERNQTSSDWHRVDDENLDGGNSCYCLQDVALVMAFKVVWHAGKPFTSYQISYNSTVLGWFELPLATLENRPSIDAIIGHVRSYMSRTKAL
jgi:hypothetical protein